MVWFTDDGHVGASVIHTQGFIIHFHRQRCFIDNDVIDNAVIDSGLVQRS